LKCNPGRPDSSEGELAFSADIPDLETKGYGNTQGAQEYRDGLDQAVFQGPRRTEGTLEEQYYAVKGRFATHPEQQGTDAERKDNGPHKQETGSPQGGFLFLRNVYAEHAVLFLFGRSDDALYKPGHT
jgi:hypothetical protein